MHSEEERIIEAVKSSTRKLLGNFGSRIEVLKSSSGSLRDVIREGCNAENALKAAKSVFGSEDVEFVAVDGTMAQDRELDMIIFYAGSYAYQGGLHFDGSGCTMTWLSACKSSASVSTAIPIYEEQEATVSGKLTEGGIELDPARLPSSLMHLSEYYLAMRALESDGDVKVVMLDRTLAGDLGHLVWSAREWLESGRSVFVGMETPYGKVTEFDLELARMLLPNDGLMLPPKRSQFLRYAIVDLLLRKGELTESEIIASISPEKSLRIKKELDRLRRDYDAFAPGKGYRLKPGTEAFWERVHYATKKLSEHVFETPPGEHPLIVKVGGEERWISSDDLDLSILYTVLALVRKAWERQALVIGLIKDTMACDLLRAVLPTLRNAGKIGGGRSAANFYFYSDKATLQNFSVVCTDGPKCPWRTIEYDTCFRTIIPEEDATLGEGEARVRGAHRNVISNERTFVKAYVQLWQSENDPSVRSHVFAYDRPCYPGLDKFGGMKLVHRDGDIEELIIPALEEGRSPVAELVMAVLESMSKEVVPEALGYNFPLFLADKKAKLVLEKARETYLSTVAFELAKGRLDQQILFNAKFREFRAEMENLRRRG